MKRAIAVFAAGVLSAAMIASLAACAEEPNDVADNAEDMVSERVGSRADWEAAFSDPTQGAGDRSYTFHNANYSIESEVRSSDGDAARVVVYEMVVADEKVHRYQRSEMYINDALHLDPNVTDNYYVADVSRYQYYYQGEDGDWTMETISDLGDVDQGVSLLATSAYTGSLTEYADEYDQFIWSDEKQGYCKSVSLTGVLGTPVTATLTLKLQGGRIAAMIISDAVPTESDNASVSISVSVMITYGGQSVTLPSV